MSKKQKTIQKDVSIAGIGLHTGCNVQLLLKPSPENTGINFVRVDLPGKPVIKADPSNIHANSGVARCTTIGNGDVVINTVEHLMSVLCGLGINNLIVEINAEELPGLDGSGLEFLKAIESVGVVEQNEDIAYFDIKEPIGVSENGASIVIYPDNDFKISYTLDYDHPFLRSQFFHINLDKDSFIKDIAPCRTFCLESEAKMLQAKGLGQGATLKNTLVVGKNGVVDNKEHFPDEFARHKVLDLIGDLYLFGIPIRGHIFAVKSGHALNFELLKKIYYQKEKYRKRSVMQTYDFADKKEINIDEIMKILPHRYPFLLVDRVVEIEKGQKAVGIKNVTINDDFFRGHFPKKPIMPGVLMIEAMAQTSGVVILTNPKHHGKLAFFMAVNNVKFRKIVTPGDQLFMEVEVMKDRTKIAQVRGIAKVGGDIVAEADMTFSFTDAEFLEE